MFFPDFFKDPVFSDPDMVIFFNFHHGLQDSGVRSYLTLGSSPCCSSRVSRLRMNSNASDFSSSRAKDMFSDPVKTSTCSGVRLDLQELGCKYRFRKRKYGEEKREMETVRERDRDMDKKCKSDKNEKDKLQVRF